MGNIYSLGFLMAARDDDADEDPMVEVVVMAEQSHYVNHNHHCSRREITLRQIGLLLILFSARTL